MKKKTYSEVLKELESIVEKMNQGDVPVDKLGETVKSASDMIRFLKGSLNATQVEINEILKNIDNDSSR
jgi:exodeoxyribonuclease VII small subunit